MIKTFVVKYPYHHTFLPDALALSHVLVTPLVLPSSIAYCGVAAVQTRPTAIIMVDSDARRQNCDKVDVKAQHITSPKLCKGILRGDPMHGPLEYAVNTPHTSYVHVSEGGKLRKDAG